MQNSNKPIYIGMYTTEVNHKELLSEKKKNKLKKIFNIL